MRFRCTARTCGQPPRGFEFQDHQGKCPKCDRTGMEEGVFPLVDIHFIVPDRSGPILGSMGRQFVACERHRPHLATWGSDYTATGDPRVVTCPSCKGTKWWQDMAKLFPELAVPDAVVEKAVADILKAAPVPAGD